MVITEDGDTTRTELAEANLSQEHTPYTYGLFADAVATWIEKQAVVSEPNINGGSNDIHSMTKAQTITYIYYPTYPGHDKAKGRSALYQVTYTIYAVYSFDQNMDYYMVHQEILGNNSTMMLSDKWKENKGTCYGFYLGEIDNDHEIFKPNGEASHQLKSLCMILDLRLLKVRIVQLRDIVLILEVISGLILLDQVLDLVPEAQYPKAIQ